MRELRESPLPLKVQAVEQPLTTMEIFELITEKLVGRERVEMHNVLSDKPVNAVQTKIPSPEKNPTQNPPSRCACSSCGRWSGGWTVPPFIPQNPPYSAGFELTTPSRPPHNPPSEPYYPFKSRLDRESTGKGGGMPRPPVSAPIAPAGGKGKGKGSGPNWPKHGTPRPQVPPQDRLLLRPVVVRSAN